MPPNRVWDMRFKMTVQPITNHLVVPVPVPVSLVFGYASQIGRWRVLWPLLCQRKYPKSQVYSADNCTRGQLCTHPPRQQTASGKNLDWDGNTVRAPRMNTVCSRRHTIHDMFTICLFISPDLDGYRAPKGITPERPEGKNTSLDA